MERSLQPTSRQTVRQRLYTDVKLCLLSYNNECRTAIFQPSNGYISSFSLVVLHTTRWLNKLYFKTWRLKVYTCWPRDSAPLNRRKHQSVSKVAHVLQLIINTNRHKETTLSKHNDLLTFNTIRSMANFRNPYLVIRFNNNTACVVFNKLNLLQHIVKDVFEIPASFYNM